MRLAGYQPQYFPRLHYFARILDADVFTISDYVQFVKKHAYPAAPGRPKYGRSYQADTPIKMAAGVQHLPVPVKHEGFQNINATRIAYESPWAERHLRVLSVNYSQARNAAPVLAQLTTLLELPYDNLAELNVATMLWGLAWLLGAPFTPPGVTLATINQALAKQNTFRLKQIVRKSETDIAPPGPGHDATDWIIDSCRKYEATEYYVGGTAQDAYIDAERFMQAGIALVQQSWTCQPYPQQFPKTPFIPNLSIIDLLINVDRATARDILTS